ncbi:hypothetical protein G7009_21160 [Pseudomonas capeferrum]|uniref:hypothetical protein n=1 Tax=Pseudomonas capeferrum TaxID=1495066 RepID=UPI0015E4797B|nr:hypothetical protein [Pseudomonas capeferrum]MBA1204230.1 hypothetical protein [Pseudomonas capeferrum]
MIQTREQLEAVRASLARQQLEREHLEDELGNCRVALAACQARLEQASENPVEHRK